MNKLKNQQFLISLLSLLIMTSCNFLGDSDRIDPRIGASGFGNASSATLICTDDQMTHGPDYGISMGPTVSQS